MVFGQVARQGNNLAIDFFTVAGNGRRRDVFRKQFLGKACQVFHVTFGSAETQNRFVPIELLGEEATGIHVKSEFTG